MENKIISSIKPKLDETDEVLLEKILKILEANGFDVYMPSIESDESEILH